jgi:hypothetical protein
MTNLSPAAQSVLDAANLVFSQAGTTAQGIAAALRAAADQLINVEWSVEMWEVHQEFHAIATELEGHQ